MAGSGVPVLLVTANVGSIFEEPSVMLKIWTEEFLSTLLRLDPKFIALHCQEVGGKNYEQSMRHVEDFVRLLMSSEELRLFDKIRVFLDEDYSSAEHFTALGNFYFVHESLKEVLLWDFKECTFVPVIGKEVHSGNIEAVTTKEKAKFPQDFFPECKWSRKGFLRTRWSLQGTVLDLINIHLFHDASNFIAMETFPSVYSKTRRRALEHTLDRFHNDKYPNAPYFLFGDFNFRTDTAGVIKKLTEDTEERKLSNKGNISKLQFRNKEDELILTLGKKEFSHCEHQNVFIKNRGEWLREYDRELEDFDGRLFEFPIEFLPSYPFEEDANEGTNYMQTRVPAWCDRVLLSPTAKTLIQNISSTNAVEYGIIGPTTCMGDHKPVYLRVILNSDAGMINCCSLPYAPEFCFRVPDNYLELLSMLPDSNSCVIARGLYTDRSSNLLHAIPVKHDPYTPDSMDSPSPNAIIAPGELPEVDVDQLNDGTYALQPTNTSHVRRRADRAVSPALLKSKLELIVRNKKFEKGDIEEDSNDIRRSPSDCYLHSCRDKHDRDWNVRKNRSNSDVSWQRSHVLTQAWVQGKGQQGYLSFINTSNQVSSNSSLPDVVAGLTSDRVIPRISIINASNFESNESSVYLHDERSNVENCLSTCSDQRTKTLSDETVDLNKSNATYIEVDIENDRLSTNLDRQIYINQNVCLDATNVDKPNENVNRTAQSTMLTKEVVSVDALRFDSKNRSTPENAEIMEDEDTNKECICQEVFTDAVSDLSTTNIKREALQTTMDTSNSHAPSEALQNIQTNFKEPDFIVNRSNVKNCKKHCIQVFKQPPSVEQECDSNVINTFSDACIHGRKSYDVEIFRSDSKQEMVGSKNTTRSNSDLSQDVSDNAGNIKLRLKAYKVTQRYKDNIVGEKARCRKCCCIVS